MKKYYFFTFVFIALGIFANKSIVAQTPATSIINNYNNYKASQKPGDETIRHKDNPNGYLFDPGYDDEFYYTDTKRAAEKHAANLLRMVYNALRVETTDIETQTKVKNIKLLTTKHGEFHIQKTENESIEFVGTFWQSNFKIGKDYIFVSEENAKYDLSSGWFHYSNAGAGEYADFNLIIRLENLLIYMLKDMKQLN